MRVSASSKKPMVRLPASMPPAAPNTLICMVGFYSGKQSSSPLHLNLNICKMPVGCRPHDDIPPSPFLTRYKLRSLHAQQKQPLKPQIVHGFIKPFPKMLRKGASSEIPNPAPLFRMGTDLQGRHTCPCRHPFPFPCKTGVYDAECARSPFTRLLLRDGTPPDALPAGAARELPAGTVQRHAGSVCGTRSHREDAADWAVHPECG